MNGAALLSWHGLLRRRPFSSHSGAMRQHRTRNPKIAREIPGSRLRAPRNDEKASAHALPGLAAAEHAAEGATLDAERVGALHRNRRVVIAAAVGIVNPAAPFRAFRFHVD